MHIYSAVVVNLFCCIVRLSCLVCVESNADGRPALYLSA